MTEKPLLHHLDLEMHLTYCAWPVEAASIAEISDILCCLELTLQEEEHVGARASGFSSSSRRARTVARALELQQL